MLSSMLCHFIRQENASQIVSLFEKSLEEKIFEMNPQSFPFEWTEVIQCYVSINASEPDAFFEGWINLVQSLIKNVPTIGPWSLDILFSWNNYLIQLAFRTEDTTKSLEECARLLNRCFVLCVTDRTIGETSRKWKTYKALDQLFRVYFILRQQNLCPSVLRAIETTDMPPFDLFPKSHTVVFRYYTGLLAFYDENYGKAYGDLFYAFSHCHKVSIKNKRIILDYFIPLSLFFGRRPLFLHKYPALQSYTRLIDALYKGNWGCYQSELSRLQKTLLKRGTFLLWEKLALIVYRQLFYRVFVCVGRNTKIPIASFQLGLKVAGCEEVNSDEIECLLANMIDKGLMKGYLSHDKGFLVLSAKDPFPCPKDTKWQQ